MTSLPSWSSRVGPLGPDPVDSGRAAELMSRVIWAGPGAGACACDITMIVQQDLSVHAMT